MNRFALIAVLSLLPALAGAQALRCKDPATGKILYTDQPCKGGELVVPARTEAEQRQDAEAAALARERALRREDIALQRERQQLQAAQAAQASQGTAARPPSESEACRAARAEASFRAASSSASEDENRTARYNAALACGQPPPQEIVVVQPPVPVYRPQRPYQYDDPRRPPRGDGGGFGVPARPAPALRPRYEPGTEPIPVRP